MSAFAELNKKPKKAKKDKKDKKAKKDKKKKKKKDLLSKLAAIEIAKADAPEMLKKVKSAAGFSLGEYSALVFGGGLSFEDGVKVVKARAEAMDEAAKASNSGMASIGGLADDKLQKALDDAAAAVGSGKAYYQSGK